MHWLSQRFCFVHGIAWQRALLFNVNTKGGNRTAPTPPRLVLKINWTFENIMNLTTVITCNIHGRLTRQWNRRHKLPSQRCKDRCPAARVNCTNHVGGGERINWASTAMKKKSEEKSSPIEYSSPQLDPDKKFIFHLVNWLFKLSVQSLGIAWSCCCSRNHWSFLAL